MSEELSRIPTNAPAWLANWIGGTDQRLKNHESTLACLVQNQDKMNEKLDIVISRLPPLSNPGAVLKANGVSHKWLSEKFWLPIVFGGMLALLGIVLAHMLGA